MVSNMGGDEPTARRILAKWNPTEQIENLNRAVAALEAEPAIKEQRLAGTLAKQVERAAHQLKGTCGYITAIDASAGAKRLQDAARVYAAAVDAGGEGDLGKACAIVVMAWRELAITLDKTQAEVRICLQVEEDSV